MLGAPLPAGEIEAILRRLDLDLKIEAPGIWQAQPPSRRFDLSCEEDLIEEVARVYGYEHLFPVANTPPSVTGSSGTAADGGPERLRDRATDRGGLDVPGHELERAVDRT